MFKYKDGEIVSNTKNTYGVCPNCDSDDIDYDIMEADTTYDGMGSSQQCTCKCCGFKFVEFYRMVYDGFVSLMDNNDLSFDLDGELA